MARAAAAQAAARLTAHAFVQLQPSLTELRAAGGVPATGLHHSRGQSRRAARASCMMHPPHAPQDTRQRSRARSAPQSAQAAALLTAHTLNELRAAGEVPATGCTTPRTKYM